MNLQNERGPTGELQDYKYEGMKSVWPSMPNYVSTTATATTGSANQQQRTPLRLDSELRSFFFLPYYVWPPALSPVAPNRQTTTTGILKGLWGVLEIYLMRSFTI